MKSFNLTEWALGHRAIVLFLILVIAVGGVLAFPRLGQLEDPNFSVPSMTALIIWPGATAQQLQDEVLNRMEKKFEQLDHFEKVVTYARQGFGGMTITVKGGTSKADQREAWYQARKKFSDIRMELPEGVIGPIFNDEYGDVSGLLYAVKGDGIGHAELSDVAEDIKRRLLRVPMVKKVDIFGKQDKKVYVEFSHQRLAALGITPLAIAESLRNQNSVIPAGSVDTSGDRVLVRVTGQFASEEDIRNVPIAAGGRLIKLGDFTTISRGFEDPPTYTVRYNGQQVLMLGITMTNDGNIVRARQGDRGRRGENRSRAPVRRGARARRRSADHRRGCGMGVRALAARSADHRARGKPHQPRLAHGNRRRALRAARARSRRPGDVRQGLEPRARLARLADHRAGAAGGRRDHRGGDDGRQDGGGLGSGEGGRLLLLGHRHAAAHRRPGHRLRFHADRVREIDHR